MREGGLSSVTLVAAHFDLDDFEFNHPRDTGDSMRVAKKIVAYPGLNETLINICINDDDWKKWFFVIQEQIKEIEGQENN